MELRSQLMGIGRAVHPNRVSVHIIESRIVTTSSVAQPARRRAFTAPMAWAARAGYRVVGSHDLLSALRFFDTAYPAASHLMRYPWGVLYGEQPLAVVNISLRLTKCDADGSSQHVRRMSGDPCDMCNRLTHCPQTLVHCRSRRGDV